MSHCKFVQPVTGHGRNVPQLQFDVTDVISIQCPPPTLLDCITLIIAEDRVPLLLLGNLKKSIYHNE